MDYRRRAKSKLDARWQEGVYLGLRLTSSEKIIGTPLGILVVESIRRKPADKQFNLEMLTAVKGTNPLAAESRERSERGCGPTPRAYRDRACGRANRAATTAGSNRTVAYVSENVHPTKRPGKVWLYRGL